MDITTATVTETTAANLVAFEAAHPGRARGKFEAIAATFGISEVRYYQLLARAVRDVDAIASDPITCRQIRERHARAASHRVRLLGA